MPAPEPQPASPSTLVIVGVGLIGGSLGLALKRSLWPGRIRGVNRPEILERALAFAAIDEGVPDLATGCWAADIVVAATPLRVTLDLLPQIARHAPTALLTDTGPTQSALLAAAHRCGAAARFLAGHPYLERFPAGLDAADARLFQGVPWLLSPATPAHQRWPAYELWMDILRRVGAQPLFLAPELHDRAVAWLQLLPALLASTLLAEQAQLLHRQPDLEPLLLASAPAANAIARLAATPFSAWRDALLTSPESVDAALNAFQQALDHLRTHLQSREVESVFHQALAMSQRIRKISGPG